jgi:hypothetical protein
MLETMVTGTRDGQLYVKKETRWCQSTPTSSIPCAQILVLNNLSGTWFWKYWSVLHIYIQIDMELLDISSLGVVYRFVVKIEHNF